VEEIPQDMDLAELFPRQGLPSGWTTERDMQLYRGRELYEYINGGADLYLEYGFEQAASQEYKGPDGAAVMVDIYRMESPEAAYGIFSVGSGTDYTTVADVGTLGAVTPYQFTFCKGEYFVSVQSLSAGEKADSALDYFARAIAGGIAAETAAPPVLVQRLPAEGLDLRSVALVRGPLGLNSRLYLGEENPLKLGGDTWGVLGIYSLSGVESLLLVLQYPDSAAAGRVVSKLAAPAGGKISAGPGPLIKTPDLWRGRGARLAAWFDLPGQGTETHRDILDEVLSY